MRSLTVRWRMALVGLAILLAIAGSWLVTQWLQPTEQALGPAAGAALPGGMGSLPDPALPPVRVERRHEPVAEGEKPEQPSGGKRVVYSSALDYLAEIYGPQWPQIRKSLRRGEPERYKFLRRLVITEDMLPPPLDEIHEKIVRALLETFDKPIEQDSMAYRAAAEEYPTPLTAEFLSERSSFSPRDLFADEPVIQYSAEQIEAAERVADAYRGRLAAARRDFFREARLIVEQEAWDGHYTAWPLAEVGPGFDGSTGLAREQSPSFDTPISLSTIIDGLWLVHLGVYLQQHPFLEELWNNLVELGAARNRDMKRAIEEAGD